MNEYKVIKKEHVKYCFDTLLAHLRKTAAPEYPSNIADFDAPLFVTWTHSQTKDLRGCIGTFEFKKLSKNLGKYTLISAVQDSRFSPISLAELPSLTCAVSVLHEFTKRSSWDEWEVGVHGIQIEYTHKGSEYQGTFLPEVASEQNWTREDTLKNLIRKSGCYENYKDILPKIKLTSYESSKLSMSFEEYSQLK